MAGPKGKERGIRDGPLSLRVGVDIPKLLGAQKQLDSSTIDKGAFQEAINARLVESIIVNRGGQEKLITTPIAYEWDSLYDAGGGGHGTSLSLYFVGPPMTTQNASGSLIWTQYGLVSS